jgi:tyrosyl-tRNA synthetase
MFRKIMQISDDLMYRYFELLTDLQADQIATLKAAVAAGEKDPMEVKMDLGRRIVADFHSAAAAQGAHEAFDREVRKGLEPADTETVDLPPQAGTPEKIRLDKLLATLLLAPSVTEASRRIKAGAVEVNGAIHKELTMDGSALAAQGNGTLVLRAGKQWKRIRLG